MKDQEEKTQAFTNLYTTYYHRVYTRVYRLLGRHQCAEDVTQEVFLKLWRVLCDSEVVSPISYTYLYRMATNKGIDFLRFEKNRSARNCELDAHAERFFEEPFEIVEEVDAASHLLASVKAEDASLLVAWACGFTIAEIASQRGLSTGTVKTRMMRTRHALVSHDEGRVAA